MHPGLGKVVDGVQLHVAKYRATVLTFVVGLLTNMEAKGRDVHRVLGKSLTAVPSKVRRPLVE